MNNKQQQLTFSKGITNVPSDALCSDNTLEESVGLVYSDSEHRVIQKPSLHMTGLNGKTLLYIHVYNDQKRYIVLDGTSLTWGTNASGTYSNGGNLFTVTGTPKITSIGKTLIVSDANGLNYFLWKESLYFPLNEFPSPKVKFWLAAGEGAKNTGNYEGIIDFNDAVDKIKDHETYNNLVIGLYTKNKKAIAQNRAFCNPFYARCALELYDGTYTKITNPVLLFPSVTKNSSANRFATRSEKNLMLSTRAYKLYVTQTQDYADYSDIVKNVVLFISDEIDIYDTTIDQPFEIYEEGDLLYDCVSISTSGIISTISSYRTTNIAQGQGGNTYGVLKQKPVADLTNDVKGVTSFYRLCEIGIRSAESIDVSGKLETHTLENITVQERIDEDEYFSHCKITGRYTYSYNSRLNLANTSRGFFEGFDFFSPYDNAATDTNVYKIYVKIETDTKNVWIEHLTEATNVKQGLYFYYPDHRASHVTIYKGTTPILDEELTEHPALHGAYFFKGMASVPNYEETEVTVGQDGYTNQETSNNDMEMLPNYILQSEVNNPFVFKAAGYFKVGTGKILAMSSVTQALSEGQFGQFPLLVFSESGIWTLAVASTGYYSSVHPMSREVALLDNPCITQTDGAVFFASEKGLMVVVGAQVKCVSEQLSGKANGENISEGAFQDYLKNAFIAYDYRDSLLWIFNPRSGYEEYCYIYSMKTGTFSKYYFTSAITSIVDNYPDYLLQSGTSVFSLLNRPNINSTEESANTYTATMITRPMKLENALALKSIMQVKHIHDMQGSLTLRIFASNKLSQSDSDWVELFSLRGVPWKYYKFRYDFTELKATDRFAGTMLITQERRTDKLR